MIIPILVLLIAMFFVPFLQLEGLIRMPGDIGDARLLNYLLENTFQFLSGGSDSLWHLPFFYPFPYVIGFSDNLFGSAPVYDFARLLNANADTAYQIWFYFGYVVNFFAAYYALRRLKGSVIAATVGALIFAFALPTSAHAGHAQLHYRFGLPLAVVFFADFLNTKRWHFFLVAGAWVVWQFYAGVYIGFFTLLFLVSMSLGYWGFVLIGSQELVKNVLNEFLLSWSVQSKNQKIVFFACFMFFLLLLLLLFYPYLQVSHLYGAKRSWSEISMMLPRPQSYFLSDTSFLWSNTGARSFSGIPMRHEHQMFVGLLPLVLALAGFFVGNREKNGSTFTLMTVMLGIVICLTLYVGGFSLWYLLHKLPLASAIRAMTRLDQVLLFPVAYLAAIAIDNFKERYSWGTKAILVLILPLLIAEAAMTSMQTSTKDSWRQRFSKLAAVAPKNLPANSILFFAQRSRSPFADEQDAMWVSLRLDKKTMNGYSGLLPPEYDYEFGSDCAQLPKRVLSYLKFSHQSENIAAYRELMSRIVPVGFNNCDPDWLHTPPTMTSADRIYSAEEFKRLSLSSGEIVKNGNQQMLLIAITNSSNNSFAANSAVGKPIRISWRFVDPAGQPLSGWDTRKNLLLDIPAQDKSVVLITLDTSKMANAIAVQVSLVQEGVFWGHDIGVQPITIPLK